MESTSSGPPHEPKRRVMRGETVCTVVGCFLALVALALLVGAFVWRWELLVIALLVGFAATTLLMLGRIIRASNDIFRA